MIVTILIGLVAGLLTGLFSVGAGAVVVPALVLLSGLSQLDAEATSLLALVPVALVGLPGDSMVKVPSVRLGHTSRWIARVESPANARANDGRSRVFCSWSITSVKPSSPGSSCTSAEMTSMAAHDRFRNSASASISNTASGGASYDSSCRNLMAHIMAERPVAGAGH